MRHYRLLILTFLIFAEDLVAQASLPKGVGAYTLGMRQYMTQTSHFDREGSKKNLASGFQKDFDGQNLLNGVGGEELKKLADQLARFDGDASTPGSLVNTLDLGSLGGTVEGRVSAYAFGMGYGLSNRLALFGYVPYVEAQVDSTLVFRNRNNVAQIRTRLGDTAFGELKAGLNRAEQINTQMIIDSITGMGYQNPNESWSYQGIGDVEFGTMYTQGISPNSSWTLKNSLSLPTGYYDDPSILNDVSVGRGYFQLKNQVSAEFAVTRNYLAGGRSSLNLGLPTTVEKRVPIAGEVLVDASRSTEVSLTPGPEMEAFVYGGIKNGNLTLTYGVGVVEHFADSYSGDLEGDYDSLGESSESEKVYHTVGASLSTVDSFKAGRFFMPVIANLSVQNALSGRNAMDDTYIELSLTSFFATSKNSSVEKLAAESKPRKKSKNSRNSIAH